MRASVGRARKTDTIEAIVEALVSVGWTITESLPASARLLVWFPFFTTTIPDPPILEEDRKLVYASKYGAFGFYNPGIMSLRRVSWYDPYREIPAIEPNVWWIPLDATAAGAMATLLSALQSVFAEFGTVSMVSTAPYTFEFVIPNAGTAWNDAYLYTRPAYATVAYHGYALWSGVGDTNQGAWKYGGYQLRSAVGLRTGRCRLKISEPNGGVYGWTGIKIVPGTDAGHFYESSYFVFDYASAMDIVANPHGFVLFSPTNESGAFKRLNFLFGSPYIPEEPYWPETAANHVYVSSSYPLEDGQFRRSARPYSLVSYDGGPLVWGDFGFVGPTYEVDTPLVYRRGNKPLISNAIVFMGTDRFNTLDSRIVGKMWDALVISKREGFPSEFVFAGKLWVEITNQRGLDGTECGVYVAYADTPTQ